MNKTEFISAVAEKSEMSVKDTAKVINAFQSVVIDTLKEGEEVSITGFGSFKSVEKEARECRNPQTGNTITVPAHVSPKFKAGKVFKDSLN